MAHGMTDEELALLTPEELAGLEDDSLVDEGEQTDDDAPDADQQAAESDDDAGEGGDAGDNAGDDAGDDQSGDDADQPGRDDGAAAEDDAEQQPQKQNAPPLIKAELPADFDDQMKAVTDRRSEIRTEKRALTDKYEDGDLTSKEYHDQLDKLDDELSELSDRRSELQWQQRKASLAQETQQSQTEARWYATVDTFMAEHPEITKNQTLVGVYDAIVQRVTAESMKAGKEPGLADLQKAYKQWAEDLGITPQKPAPKEQQKTQEQQRKRNVPPTLAHVPAAEANDTDDGKYAYLDRLADKDPIKYEAEIAKLTPTQWEEYSNS